MKILFFTQFFSPESIAPSFRATENAKHWRRMGHVVTVFTGYPNYPTGRVFDGYAPKLLTEQNVDGIRVLRSKLIAVPNRTIIGRLENALSYYFFGLINIHFRKKRIGKDYDVVLGTSGVIFNALLAQLYASKIHVPFVLEIRDITFLQMMATGKRKNDFFVACMKRLEMYLCRKAAKVVVVTNGYREVLVDEGVPKDKIDVIFNGVDVDKTQGAYSENKQFIISYFGTLGLSQNICDTIQYAKVIKNQLLDVQYLIIGDGAQKAEIEEAAQKESFVKVIKSMPLPMLETYYNDTQLSIISLIKNENFKYTIPSKLFQIMGRGIAVLFIGPDGESAEIIRKSGAGIALVGSLEEDIDILRTFFSNPNWRSQLNRMGENGYRTIKEHYSRKKLAEQYIQLLEREKRLMNG